MDVLIQSSWCYLYVYGESERVCKCVSVASSVEHGSGSGLPDVNELRVAHKLHLNCTSAARRLRAPKTIDWP